MVKYLKPINNKIEEIKKAPSKGIFLVGEEGSGKTSTLLEYVKRNKNTNNPVIDITLVGNYSLIIYGNIAKLFQMCNIIQKMLLYIKDVDLNNYIDHFIFFDAKITNIQRDIVTMYSLGKYNIENTSIDEIVLTNPEILLEDFLSKLFNYLNYQDITVILDNFDVEKPYMYLYQTYIYKLLKKYFKVVATISDPNVINNPEYLNALAQNNSLVMMDYNRNVNVVKNILNYAFKQTQNKKVISKRIDFIFDDNTINELIKKTNGNIFKMNLIMTAFFERAKDIDFNQYVNCLFAVADEYLSINELLQENSRKRKLYLK